MSLSENLKKDLLDAVLSAVDRAVEHSGVGQHSAERIRSFLQKEANVVEALTLVLETEVRATIPDPIFGLLEVSDRVFELPTTPGRHRDESTLH